MKRGAYLLPSSLTLANMGLGFFAIIQAIHGNYPAAALAIVFGHVADVIDGMVARLTKTTSTFGLEFDSFADWITFGIAPALLIYQICLHEMGKIGFVIALFYVITGSLRLAKFNIKANEKNNDDGDGSFVGLPIPGAGGVLAAIVLVNDAATRPQVTKMVPIIMKMVPYLMKWIPFIMFFLSILMVSQVSFVSSKKTKLFRPHSLRSIVYWVIWGLLLYVYPQNFTFILYVTYISWGIVGYIIRMYRLRRKRHEAV